MFSSVARPLSSNLIGAKTAPIRFSGDRSFFVGGIPRRRFPPSFFNPRHYLFRRPLAHRQVAFFISRTGRCETAGEDGAYRLLEGCLEGCPAARRGLLLV
jgi:hypothetical protein